MTLDAKTNLDKALADMRQREAMRLNWRVIGCSEGVPFGTDEQFYYLQGHDNKGKPLDCCNYPVPAIIYVPDFESGTLWEYTGNPDNIASRYRTYYKRVR